MAYSLDDAFTVTLPVRGKSSSRRGNDVRLAIFHTAEGARTVQSLASWFNNPAAQASSHAGADDRHLSRMVPESQSAWTASKANPHATQIELCGFARWSAAEWRDHPNMLEYAARWAAAVSVYHGIPLVRLKPSQVRSGRGFCMHHDITVGWPTGSHTDCGSAFRDHIFDGVLARARQIVAAGSHAAGAPIAPTPAPAEKDWFDMATSAELGAIITERVNDALKSHLAAVRADQEVAKRADLDQTGKLDLLVKQTRVTDDRLNVGLRELQTARLTDARVRAAVEGLGIPAATVGEAASRLRALLGDVVDETTS